MPLVQIQPSFAPTRIQMQQSTSCCVRQVVRRINPSCHCTLEVENFAQSRFYVRGTPTMNAYSEDDAMDSEHAIMSVEWVNRPDEVNRAACIAGGGIVEEVPDQAREAYV